MCEGPTEEDLYARGVAYVESDFPNMDRVRGVTVMPHPTDHNPRWYYGNGKHHFSWSEGGAGHDLAFYAALAASAMFLFYLIRRQVHGRGGDAAKGGAVHGGRGRGRREGRGEGDDGRSGDARGRRAEEARIPLAERFVGVPGGGDRARGG